MSMADKAASWAGALGASLKSLAKIALQTRRCAVPRRSSGNDTLVVLGNGPSLRGVLDSGSAALARYPLMAVNFFANTPEFQVLNPEYYVLADPHFFRNPDDANVARLIMNLAAADWPMTLFVPATANMPELPDGTKVTVCRYNCVGVEGFGWLERLAFNSRRGMPRPRNVLIPSIMLGLWMGFRRIYLLGADHSWLGSLAVDEQNRVATVQPHFYKEDDRELSRIKAEYIKRPLHDVLRGFYLAFKSYHTIEPYARSIGATVYNATPGSFIDAFERAPLPGGHQTPNEQK